MAITAAVILPKRTPSTQYNFSVATVAATEDTTNKTWFSARRATIDPPAFDLAGTITTAGGTTTITAAEPNGFAKVREGDAISLSANNTSGAALPATTVATKLDDNTITTTDDATNDGTGESILSINPAQITPTLYAIEERHFYTGSSIRVELWGYEYDGSLGSTNGTAVNATNSRKLAEFTIDAASFLDKVRVTRTNLDSVTL